MIFMNWLTDWSNQWDDTSQNRGHQCAFLFIPQMICERGELWWWWYSLGKTPDSSTRALWQFYQLRHLGAGRTNGQRSENFVYRYLRNINGYSTCCKIMRHGTSRFKECVLRILSSLKINCLGWVWTNDPWAQWQSLTTAPLRWHFYE
jgi:hypothetical protein